MAWKKIAYKKMILLMIDRIGVMAASGEYWEEAYEPIEKMRKKIETAYKERIVSSKDFFADEFLELQLILTDPRRLYDFIAESLRSSAEVLGELHRFLAGHDAIIFGAGPMGKYVADLLRINYRCVIKEYWDNAEDKQGLKKDGIVISKPHSPKGGEKIILAVYEKNRYAMEKQLIDLGYEKKNVFVYEAMHIDSRLYFPNVFMK